jgi:hypothetical protein
MERGTVCDVEIITLMRAGVIVGSCNHRSRVTELSAFLLAGSAGSNEALKPINGA